ncbi:MAG: tetratricopeptide repeat-containing sulfotransferase family protein [Hyphomonas sp.]
MSEKRLEALLREVDDLVAAGNAAAAVARLKQALVAGPLFYRGWIRLGQLLHQAKSYREAVRAVRAAEQCDPMQAEFLSIQASMQRRDFARASLTARRMLEREPGHPRAVFTLAHIAGLAGDDEKRLEALEAGLSVSPANLFLRGQLLAAQEEAGHYRAALETAHQIAEIEGGFKGYWGLASLLFRFGQNTQALDACDLALHACGGDRLRLSEIELLRGQIYRILGDSLNAQASLRQALEHNQLNAAAWWALADMKTLRFSEADTAAMRGLVSMAQAGPDQKSMAAFALARALETDGCWDSAMEQYHAANQFRTADSFDPAAFSDAILRMTTLFTKEALSAQAGPLADGPVPVFIVGLPRSGSTLLEQMLACHSQIEGTHELPVLPSVKRRAHRLCAERFRSSYLSALGQITPVELASLGERYLDESALFRTGAKRFFTDKMPFNFEHIGLIHKILPSAVIIDIRRNPLDCGLSLYKQYFTQGSGFSYSLEGIGHYYNGYLRLMDHWNSVLPGRVLCVRYEALVEDPEAQLSAILSHIGLAYEPGCLDFHKSARPVRTASSEQVRRPMNASGIGIWRRAEAHLEPLKAALGKATLARFEPDLGAG